jgi:hypothetical protein
VTNRAAQLAISAGLVVILCGYVLDAAVGFGRQFPRSALFPLAVGVPSLALAVAALLAEWRGAGAAAETNVAPVEITQAVEDDGPPLDPSVERARTLAAIGWVIAFFLGIWLIGFYPTAAGLTLVYLRLGAGERWPASIAFSAFTFLFFFALFELLVHVPFPHGILIEWIFG